MNSEEIRRKFLDFFQKRGHAVVHSSSLVPDNDSSVLLTTAGMQQFKPYYIGLADAQKDFGSLNTASIQKCFRTSDIDEVGDESHLTFFEMLGNFSFGGYWKKEAIEYAYEFITEDMELKIDYVTVFQGEDDVPEDEESEKIWRSVDSSLEIRKFGRVDNFWGPTGEEGPCGPTTEIYVNGLEIWNIVFNEFHQDKNQTLKPLETKGIDTGMGLERLARVVQKVPAVFETDLFKTLFNVLPEDIPKRKKRILADHIRAICFMINDGVRPSNKGTGYVLRRLLRRVLAQFKWGNIKLSVDNVTAKFYNIYQLDQQAIWQVIEAEWSQFIVSLNLGMKELDKLKEIDSDTAFLLYNSYGLPIDIIKDKFPDFDFSGFEKRSKEHQEISKAGMERKFKGGLAGHSEMEVKYHTATHLLHQALHDVLGDEIKQRGSNITPERLRFDFAFPRKLTLEERRELENIVNGKIRANLPVQSQILPKAEALRSGARHFFDQKYFDQVKIYYIGGSLETAYSKEFCGGPHVEHTGILGQFKITKEEAVSTGTRRIKAILE